MESSQESTAALNHEGHSTSFNIAGFTKDEVSSDVPQIFTCQLSVQHRSFLKNSMKLTCTDAENEIKLNAKIFGKTVERKAAGYCPRYGRLPIDFSLTRQHPHADINYQDIDTATAQHNMLFLALLLIALCTGQAPPQYSAVPVSHFGSIPGPTQCFDQGPGVLHVAAIWICCDVARARTDFSYRSGCRS